MPRMRWRPGLRTAPRWGAHQTLQSAGDPRTPRLSAPRFSRFRRSLLGPSFLAYIQLNFSNIPLIGSIVILHSRCCFPNDEGPGPPNIFSQNRHWSRAINIGYVQNQRPINPMNLICLNSFSIKSAQTSGRIGVNTYCNIQRCKIITY